MYMSFEEFYVLTAEKGGKTDIALKTLQYFYKVWDKSTMTGDIDPWSLIALENGDRYDTYTASEFWTLIEMKFDETGDAIYEIAMDTISALMSAYNGNLY